MKLVVHPGAERWLPDAWARAALEHRFPGASYRAHLWPRSQVDQVHGVRSPPWAFRAFTRDGESHLFVDETETQASIAWLLAHELAHQVISREPELDALLKEARPAQLGPSSDSFHELDPEEVLADGIATNLFGERLDRDWWRQRVQAPEMGPLEHSAIFGGLFTGRVY